MYRTYRSVCTEFYDTVQYNGKSLRALSEDTIQYRRPHIYCCVLENTPPPPRIWGCVFYGGRDGVATKKEEKTSGKCKKILENGKLKSEMYEKRGKMKVKNVALSGKEESLDTFV
jgi:hypothetical protein